MNLTAEQAGSIRDYRFTERLECENEGNRRLIEAGVRLVSVRLLDYGPLPDEARGSGNARPISVRSGRYRWRKQASHSSFRMRQAESSCSEQRADHGGS